MKTLTMFTLFCIIQLTIFNQDAEELHYFTTRNSLRILDINVWSGLNYKGYIKMGEYESDAVREKRYRALLTQIKKLDPDIIGIHEANKLPHYIERLAEAIGYEAFYHVGLGGVRLGPIGLPWNLREGDGILTKKFLNPQFVGRKKLLGGYVGNWAAFHFSDATQVIGVKIIYNNKPYFIFATHWHAPAFDSLRIFTKVKELIDTGETTEAESQKLLLRIKKVNDLRLSESKKTIEFIKVIAKDRPFILIGDFNAVPESREIRNLIQFGMVDSFQSSNPDSTGFTYDPRTNLNYTVQYLKDKRPDKKSSLYEKLVHYDRASPKRIDYIFLGPSSIVTSHKIAIKSSQVVLKGIIDGVHASDHYGIFTEIEINE